MSSPQSATGDPAGSCPPTAGGRFYGAVVKVADMARCRAFYSDVLGLGKPVVSSNFWVEYQIVPQPMVLALQQHAAANTPGICGVAWCLEVTDLAAFRDRLLALGCRPQNRSELPSGSQALTYSDPEGNPFMVLEKPKSVPP